MTDKSSDSSGNESDASLQEIPPSNPPKAKAKVEVAVGKSKAKVPSRRGRKKRPKDCPKRPLSAYNLFFKEQRYALSAARSSEVLIAEASAILKSDANAKQPNKPLNLFKALAVLISRQWNTLDPEQKRPYEAQASEEMSKYQTKLTEYKIMVERKKLTAGKHGAEKSEKGKNQDNTGVWPQQEEHGSTSEADSKPPARDLSGTRREDSNPTREDTAFTLQPNPINYAPLDNLAFGSAGGDTFLANNAGSSNVFTNQSANPSRGSAFLPNNLAHLQQQSRHLANILQMQQQLWNQQQQQQQQQQQSSFATSQSNSIITASRANQSFTSDARFQQNQQEEQGQYSTSSSMAANLQAFRDQFGPGNQTTQDNYLSEPGSTNNQTQLASNFTPSSFISSSTEQQQRVGPSQSSAYPQHQQGHDFPNANQSLAFHMQQQQQHQVHQFHQAQLDAMTNSQEPAPMSAVSQHQGNSLQSSLGDNNMANYSAAATGIFFAASASPPASTENNDSGQVGHQPHIPGPGPSSSFDEENCKPS